MKNNSHGQRSRCRAGERTSASAGSSLRREMAMIPEGGVRRNCLLVSLHCGATSFLEWAAFISSSVRNFAGVMELQLLMEDDGPFFVCIIGGKLALVQL